MKTKINFTFLELIIVLIIILTLLAIVVPFLDISQKYSFGANEMHHSKDIGFVMFAYAENDIKQFKMPYPLAKGKEKVWGNSSACWSTSVAELLFTKKYFKKSEKNILKSTSAFGAFYKSMNLSDDTIYQNSYWDKNTELDFHIYCDKDLTSNINGKMVLVATYDNDDIRDCQFRGQRWVVFYSDKTTSFIKRKKFKDVSDSIKSINAIEGSIAGPGIILRKNIPESEGGPGTFGNFWYTI